MVTKKGKPISKNSYKPLQGSILKCKNITDQFLAHMRKRILKQLSAKYTCLNSNMQQYSHKSLLISECSSHTSETTFEEGIILTLFLVFATLTNTEKLDIAWVLRREFPKLVFWNTLYF